MLQKSGGGTSVIPDTEGTGTFVTISCQSNHMKWNDSVILAGSIGFLGVSSMIWSVIARRAGHHSYLSVLFRGCSGQDHASVPLHVVQLACYGHKITGAFGVRSNEHPPS